jgi:hypothetical protein
MPDTITIRDANGVLVDVSVDDITSLNGAPVSGLHLQRFKLVFGGDAAGQDVDPTHPLPVTVTDFPSTQGVSAALDSPVGVRLSDGASAIGSTAQRLWVDDGGSSLTVDGQVTPTTAGDVATALAVGRKTVTTAGTPVAISSASLTCKWVQVTALKTNTGQVNVGGTGVSAVLGSSTGDPLNAGESVTYPVDNANKVFVDARVAGEGVSFTVGS